MGKLATIGYEKSTLEDFIATLQAAKIRILVDVRQIPASRRPGFSKNVLASALEEEGIDYVHLVGLGDPKEGREAARAGKHDEFLQVFQTHMKTAEALEHLDDAVKIVEGGGACLLCYERDPNECHRRLVAERLSDIVGLKIRHIGVREGIAANGIKGRPGKGSRSGKSSSAGGRSAR